MDVTTSPVPTTGQINPHALLGPDDTIEAVQGDIQSFLAADPFPDRWTVRAARTAEALLVRVMRLVKQPVIVILVLLLLAPGVLGATKDDDEDDLPQTSKKTKGKNKPKDRPAPEVDEDESKAGACSRGGQHVFKGSAKVTKFPIYGRTKCERVLTSKTCSKCKSDITYKVEMVGDCKDPGPGGVGC